MPRSFLFFPFFTFFHFDLFQVPTWIEPSTCYFLVVVPITVQTIRPTARQPRGWIQQPDVLDPDTRSRAQRRRRRRERRRRRRRRRRREGRCGRKTEEERQEHNHRRRRRCPWEHAYCVFFFHFPYCSTLWLLREADCLGAFRRSFWGAFFCNSHVSRPFPLVVSPFCIT